MKVKEIMSTQVQRIYKGATIREAADKMKTIDVGMVPVYEGDRLVGTLTDRDIVVRAIAQNSDLASATVGDVMSPGVAYCYEDQEDKEAAELMADKQIRRLIVLNRNKRLVGILSLGDLATRSNPARVAAPALENVSKSPV